MVNVPDDWGMYWTTCSNGHRFHMSENYCDRCPEEEEEEEMNASIKITFAERQTQDSPYSHFNGGEEELINLVQQNFHLAKQGYREGVILVPLPPENFSSGVVLLQEGDPLKGEFKRRRPTEEPRKLHGAVSREKIPAQSVEIVLYSREVLEEEQGYVAIADYEVISINASPTKEPTPLTPQTLMANHFLVSGGTSTGYSPEQFEVACKESFLYWKDKEMCW